LLKLKVRYNEAIKKSKPLLQASARTYKKPKKPQQNDEREREQEVWAWKGYVEPEGSQFGKGVVDYSPAWFMQAQTVSRIRLLLA
jgi:hypothetical protein